jgi:hypothetical protein
VSGLVGDGLYRGLDQISGGQALRAQASIRFNIADLFDTAKKLNDLADRARADGWTVEMVAADYVAIDVTKAQKGSAQ